MPTICLQHAQHVRRRGELAVDRGGVGCAGAPRGERRCAEQEEGAQRTPACCWEGLGGEKEKVLAACFEVLSRPLGLRTSVAVRVRQVRKRGAVRTRQGTERSQQCSSGRAVFATAPCSVIRFRLPMPDVTVWVQAGFDVGFD